MYSIETICSIIGGKFLKHQSEGVIEYLVHDSRRVQEPLNSLFFAIKTNHNNGHRYISDAYKKGVKNFVVSENVILTELEQASVIIVDDVLISLQKLAQFHRSQFSLPVIGITGSNGKTIVKEWLYQLLHEDYNIVRSPKSYNSQLGVPLSVWQINEQHNLGVFEAGISLPGEMEHLASIIQPTIGIFTNLGEAHNANFSSPGEKLAEKLKLFERTNILIGEFLPLKEVHTTSPLFTWGYEKQSSLCIKTIDKKKHGTEITAMHLEKELRVFIPFTDNASIQNAIHCWCLLIYLKIPEEIIYKRFCHLHPVDMRLQLQHGINGCLIINDSYSADLTSLKIALDFLKQQATGLVKTIILSDFIESGLSDKRLYAQIADLLKSYKVKKLIGIGEKMGACIKDYLPDNIVMESYKSTDEYIKNFFSSSFLNEIILIKGARKFQFERIAQMFELRLHQTVLEINLNAVAQNLKEYRKLLHPATKVMGMVKAFSYGSGGAEIASILQFHNLDYLGVAYADEGVELVRAGITLPIMVINTEEVSFQAIVDYQLEPVLYSMEIMNRFESYLLQQGLGTWPIHIEIETGMNRLGFAVSEVEQLASRLAAGNILRVKSVFTHLAASEEADQDLFTKSQYSLFMESIGQIERFLPYAFLKHVSNSAAIVRHPLLQMDMVRLGIGLYGIETDNEHRLDLVPVATLRSTIAQIKRIKKGESVGYNRKSVVNRDSVIATIRIGYADGFSRQLGNGRGKMLINGKLAPVIGSVCMDMTMLDVTDLNNVKEGDDVIVFGVSLPLQQVARWMNTIPYEIMTSISQRVKRIYFHE